MVGEPKSTLRISRLTYLSRNRSRIEYDKIVGQTQFISSGLDPSTRDV